LVVTERRKASRWDQEHARVGGDRVGGARLVIEQRNSHGIRRSEPTQDQLLAVGDVSAIFTPVAMT
jgi:hypothetical protein